MNLKKSFSFLFMVAALLIAVNVLCAQETKTPFGNVSKISKPSPPKRDSNAKGGFYRLDLTMLEMEEGNTISTRSFSLWLKATAGDYGVLRISNSVPIVGDAMSENILSTTEKPAKPAQKSVSVDLSCTLKEIASGLELNITGTVGGVVPPEKGKQYPPVFRNISIRATALLTPGKSTTISSIDDPGSNRHFQIDATATKIK
jgi:hypothetical protein